MADAPQTIPTPPVPPSPGRPASDQPPLSRLENLHRMSRTAGLGSSDYTAVNVTAVVAVLIAAASALALIAPVFLFLSVLGVVFAAVAIKQIRSSNGTQTGLPLAVLALVLTLGVTTVTGYRYTRSVIQQNNDTRDLDSVAGRFGQLLAEGKYTDAYAMTDQRFKDEVSLERFEGLFEEIKRVPGFGPVTGVRTSKLFSIEADPDTGLRVGRGFAMFDTQNKSGNEALRTEMAYRYAGDEWKVLTIPKLFPPPQSTPGAAPGQSAGQTPH
ncbi:MAG TPA: hypothetical protein VF595_00165 [Tepidisphaeraceae bacterium]|jgi:membrane protein implicated in regulation of membrane protease activity